MKKKEPRYVKRETIIAPEGQWVVVVKGKVIAHSNDVKKMLELAEKYPERDTLVTKMLYHGASFY